MGARRIRRDQRNADQAQSRLLNGERKVAERARRDQRMKQLVKKAKPPYTPAIQSWLSSKLNKPSRLITAQEVATLIK
jgi:hypothetical protein